MTILGHKHKIGIAVFCGFGPCAEGNSHCGLVLGFAHIDSHDTTAIVLFERQADIVELESLAQT